MPCGIQHRQQQTEETVEMRAIFIVIVHKINRLFRITKYDGICNDRINVEQTGVLHKLL